MYLYDKKKNKIYVYFVDEREIDIADFRKQEIKKIPYENRILVYTDKNFNWLISYQTYPLFNEEGLNYSSIDEMDKDSLLRNYYKGQYNSSSIQIIQGRDGLRYLLDTEGVCSRDWKGLRQVTNIIELPRTLYSLQMFKQEKFARLKDSDISKLADLFEVSKIDEISIPQLQKIDEYGFTENVYDKVCQVADSHNRVLSLIKKR